MRIQGRLLASLLSLGFASIACSSESNSAAAPGGEGGGRGGRGGGPVPVVTTHVMAKPMPVTIGAVGTVEPVSSVQVRAQVTGQLSAIHFADGQNVQKGQRLFSLDPRPFQAALAQAEAVLARDTAMAQNAHAQKARSEDLFKRGLIPRDQYETLTASAAALDATLAADKAALESARLNLQYAEISAPISGRTGERGIHVGDQVRANDTTPLVVINQLSPVYVTFSVPGRYLADIRRFQAQKPLEVVATAPSSEPNTAETGKGPNSSDVKPVRGTVSFIDNSVDPTTGTIRLKGTFQSADHQLWPGAFVQVTLQLTTDKNALVVPATAVQASQEGQYVYVVKADRTVEMRTVTVARQQGDEMVVSGGITAGEEVVTDGQLRLTPGARVSSGRGGADGRADRSGDPARGGAPSRGNGRGDGTGGRKSGQ
jgi:multidrug efflux system membrane fusion protein